MTMNKTEAVKAARTQYRQKMGLIFQMAMMAGDAVYEEAKHLAFEQRLDLDELEKSVHALCLKAADIEAGRIISVYNTTRHW